LLDESQVFLARTLESTQPWKVNTDPTKDPRQNVTLHYAIELDGLELAEKLPAVSNENDENNEVADVKWVPVDEAIQMDLAFGHQHYIREFCET
jgi:8-oxo-dGTP pyrophosphatase MutT (NUDIX family)